MAWRGPTQRPRKPPPAAAGARIGGGGGWMRESSWLRGKASAYATGLCALVVAGAAAASWARGAARSARSAALPTSYLSSYAVVAELAHRPSAFTQGLCIDARGVMWESVGNYGHSALHRLALERRARGASAAEPADGGAEDGRPERFELPAALFAEGLACLPGDRLLQLTWREGVVLEFETRPRLAHARTRALGSEFRGAAAAGAGAPRRPREMWGAAFFPAPAAPSGEVAVSNGSSVLAFLDARTLAVRRTVRVHDRRLGVWVEGLNELEVVEGEVWANVYPMYQRRASRCVARVEPRTGEVLGWLDLSGLAEAQPEAVRLYPDHYVLNGIAYNASRDGAVEPAAGGRHRHRELYVTGKHWDRIYQIQLGTDARTDDEAVAHVRRACNLYLGATYPAGGATGGQSQANPAGGGRRGGKRALGQ